MYYYIYFFFFFREGSRQVDHGELVGSPPPGGLIEKRTRKVQLRHPTLQGHK